MLGMSSEERLEMLRGRAKEWCEPWRSALSWLGEGTVVNADRISLWKGITCWGNHGGRVTLAGDAAHAMPPCTCRFLSLSS